MTFLLVFIIYIVCGIVVSTAQQIDPFYHLTNEYHFDGTDGATVRLTNLVCVKGNNPRSIKFQMRASPPLTGSSALIGMYVPTYDVMIIIFL